MTDGRTVLRSAKSEASQKKPHFFPKYSRSRISLHMASLETAKKKSRHVIGLNASVAFRCTPPCYRDVLVLTRKELRKSSWLKFSLNKTVMGSGKRIYINNISLLD